MNLNQRHPIDETVDSELEGLRAPLHSHRIGAAISAMQATPQPSIWRRKRWQFGVGSAALCTVAVVLVVSLSTTRAYAGDLQAIGNAQDHQKTMHKRTTFFDTDGKSLYYFDYWIDHEKVAFRQFSARGELVVARVSDGKRLYHFEPHNPSTNGPYAVVQDGAEGTEKISSLQQIFSMPFYRTHTVEKRKGIKLNGTNCDFYWIANGFYRLWVDPVTKLPLQGETHDRGKVLYKRDVYEYPKAFPEGTFEPVRPNGVVYVKRTPSAPSAAQRAKSGN